MVVLVLLAACGGQAATAPAPAVTAVAQPGEPSATETPAAPATESTVEQPTQAAATPTEVVEEAPAEPSGQSTETTGEQNDQPTATAAAQEAPTSPATTEPAAELPATGCEGELEATVSNSEGPYYKSGAPERAVLFEAGMAGTRLVLTGQVLTTDCQPVAGALLDFWQANDQGEYDNVGYTLRGTQFADETGHYRLETILPGLYPGRPPHIHVKVSAPGGPVLTTQIYFEGMPGNESDGLVQSSLIVPLADAGDGGKTATFNFVLPSD
jgi:protocatechuate 3,4-dioxygenase beta subunit